MYVVNAEMMQCKKDEGRHSDSSMARDLLAEDARHPFTISTLVKEHVARKVGVGILVFSFFTIVVNWPGTICQPALDAIIVEHIAPLTLAATLVLALLSHWRV